MTEKVIIAGAGGQGIMVLGKVLATAAMIEDKQVTWLPVYGPEVRGGSAHCSVVISDDEIGSPWVDQADTLIVMNALSLKRFQERLKIGGLLIINSSLVTKGERKSNVKILELPFTDIANKLGNIKTANIVALGCYLTQKKIVSINSVIKAIQELAPKGREDLIEINKKALLAGKELVK
jgi:2-oxoglutarate ferredoxin oxidoreductase subunit gamma